MDFRTYIWTILGKGVSKSHHPEQPNYGGVIVTLKVGPQ